MKKTIVIAGLTVILLGNGYILAQDDQAHSDAGQAVAKKAQTTCPIMGGAVNTNIYADADGKRVYFCCKGCPAEFKKDPAKYINKMEKDGITLDKAPAKDPARKEQPAKPEAVKPEGDEHSGHKGGGAGCCM
ncbi:MAG: hypothetical protein KKG09_09260 [Verrucomicrobia bacterium]|nr:hypothetical protein [Verrucomicrobiota bacterium]MCG2680158.1 hypothetical protein [Kiritimatiellia bacterium]MBU4247067.1 hypothetical protein [Verrucomicrobiota bacterium]MBU4291141.1 hypothetical protein [Verrucomicrobiota bacterium]MBU4428009.1 hypothetical protein [Verrucomicrobiota bacterium]